MHTYADLRQIAARAVGIDANQADDDEARRLDRVVQEALTAVSLARPWRFLVVGFNLGLPAGSDRVALWSDFQGFDRNVRLSYGIGQAERPLGELTVSEVNELRSGGIVTGAPQAFAVGAVDGDPASAYYGRQFLELYPRPDRAYSIVGTYRRRVRPAADLTARVDLPPELHVALPDAVRAAAMAEFNNDPDAAAAWEAACGRKIEAAWAVLNVVAHSPLALRDRMRFARSAGVERGIEARLDPSDFPS